MDNLQSGYVNINDTRVYYELGGKADAETLVFLHAGVADRRLYDAQFEYFAPRYNVMRYDLRGAGNTEAPIPSETPFSFVDDLHQLLALLSIERAVLIGTSNGGQVALDYALTYPNQVSALILTCATISGYEMQGEPPELMKQVGEAMQQGDTERVADLGAQLWYVGINRTRDQVNEEGFEQARAMILQAFTRTGAGLGEERGIRPPAVKRLDEVKAPTLVIIGTEDHPAIREMDELIVEEVPDARKVVMENTAHLPSLEHPEQYTRIVAEFLDDVLK